MICRNSVPSFMLLSQNAQFHENLIEIRSTICKHFLGKRGSGVKGGKDNFRLYHIDNTQQPKNKKTKTTTTTKATINKQGWEKGGKWGDNFSSVAILFQTKNVDEV